MVVSQTPEPAALTTAELRTWLQAHGVADADMAQALTEHAGRTEADMDAAYDAAHGSMA